MAASVVERFREPAVDESAPFHVGHPLDRVPGMLLFSGLLDLAVRADSARSRGRRAGRVVAGLDFPWSCEFERGTTLSCRPVPGRNRAWTVAARRVRPPRSRLPGTRPRTSCTGTGRRTSR